MAASREAEAPVEFRCALDSLKTARPRPEVNLAQVPAPQRLAPHATAMSAEVDTGAESELAMGRLVLLHDPAGQDEWAGTFRFVTFAQAELEPEMVTDPLLPSVGWAWLIESLQARGAGFTIPSGTVTRVVSESFGGMADRPMSTQLEVRASWSPTDEDLGRHLEAWCELLCTAAGLPPSAPGVAALPHHDRRSL